MHKLILSPGVQGADVKEYCREVMSDLSSRKGLDLEWYAVRHDNTNNPHVHIVVMGTDENGHKVRLTKEDYTKIKEAGDRYLERNRLLDREEKEKEKDKDIDIDIDQDERNPVNRFVDALKVAAREFSRSMERDAGGEKKPETKFEQRRREKDEERQQEIAALGETIDLDEYLAKQAAKEERQQAKKEKAWKEYCKPISIDHESEEPKTYDRSSSFKSLRELEKDYQDRDVQVRSSMTEADHTRLNDWIKEKFRDERRIENKAAKLENIDVELDGEAKGSWSKASSLEDLRKLEALNDRGEIFLDEAEKRALANWTKDQELKQPVRIELEPGSEPVVYDREDSKESLQFLAREYEKGEQWARENLSSKDYQKIKTWIVEKDKSKEPEKQPDEKEARLKVGNKFVSKDMDAEALRTARNDLEKSPEQHTEDIERLDRWISTREQEETKDPAKKEYSPRRKRTAKEKSMDRAVRVDRMERWSNYHKEKSEQREHLEGQRENLKEQKRTLNKYEKERETVDGEYSEIWGVDKSAIAAGSMGAASGGARPLGVKQFVKLVSQAIKQHQMEREQRTAKETQIRLENNLTEDQKTEPKTESKDLPNEETKKNKIKPLGTEREDPLKDRKEVAKDDNAALEKETGALEQDVKNRKKAENDRDPRPDREDRQDPFKYDPWGRY
jgi:hypothetical protein